MRRRDFVGRTPAGRSARAFDFFVLLVPAGAPVALFCLTLAGVHIALGLVWCALLIGLTQPLGRALRRPRVVGALDRLTGGVFVAFGVRLAATQS